MPLKLFPPGSRKGNRFYVAKGRIDGQQYEVVCRDEHDQKTADRRVAERFVKWFTRNVRAAVERERREARDDAPTTFSDGIEAYMLAVQPSRNDRRYLDRLDAEIGHLPLSAVTQDQIHAAGRRLYPDAMNETVNRQAIAPAAAVLHYAAESDWVPYRRIKRLKEREPETRRPATGVVDLLLKNTTGKEHLLLLFLALQGTRITETLGLKAEHTDLQNETFRLYIGKREKWKTLLLHREVVVAFANETPESDGYWFPWRDRGKVYDWLRPLCKRLGVTLTPHMLRHEFGGRLREMGATARDLVDVGSWTSVKSTARYQDAPTEHARDVLHRARGTVRGKWRK